MKLRRTHPQRTAIKIIAITLILCLTMFIASTPVISKTVEIEQVQTEEAFIDLAPVYIHMGDVEYKNNTSYVPFWSEIGNFGTIPSGPFTITWLLNGQVMDEQSFPSLNPGQVIEGTEERFRWERKTGGYVITVHVDRENDPACHPNYQCGEIIESNEDNNDLSIHTAYSSGGNPTWPEPDLDLLPLAITYQPYYFFKAGDTITFKPKLVSRDVLESSPFMIEWSIDGEVQETIEHPEIGSHQLSHGKANFEWVAEPGVHTISMELDTLNQIPEDGNEENNTFQITLNIPFDIDLQPTDIAFNLDGIMPGDTVVFDSGVTNSGTKYADRFETAWYVDSEVVKIKTHPGINGGQSNFHDLSSELSWTAAEGEHTFSFQVDSDNGISEIDETNNHITITTAVGIDLFPKLLTETITFDEKEFIDNGIAEFNTGVHNNGNLPSGEFPVRWRVNGTEHLTGTHPSVLPFSSIIDDPSTELTLENIDENGQYFVEFEIDDPTPGVVDEYDELNNTAVYSLIKGVDLEPLPIEIVSGKLVSGTYVIFNSSVRNNGSEISPFFTVRWYVDDVPLSVGGHTEIPGFTEVDDGNSGFFWQVEEGIHTIKFDVNEQYIDQEVVKTNNSVELTVAVGVDLQTGAIEYNKQAFTEGEQVTFVSTVENVGTMESGEFDVAWFVDGQMKIAKHYQNLLSDATTYSTFTWNIEPGDHTVSFVADPDLAVAPDPAPGAVSELNEDNNQTTIQVPPPICYELQLSTTTGGVVHVLDPQTGNPLSSDLACDPVSNTSQRDQTYYFTAGTPLQLEAVHPIFVFTGWAGDGITSETQRENPLSISMDDDLSLAALFSDCNLLDIDIIGQGSVSADPIKSDGCQEEYTYVGGESPDSVRITAVPAPGSFFIGWAGDIGEADPLSKEIEIEVNANTHLIVTFKEQTTLIRYDFNHNEENEIKETVGQHISMFSEKTIVKNNAVPSYQWHWLPGEIEGGVNQINNEYLQFSDENRTRINIPLSEKMTFAGTGLYIETKIDPIVDASTHVIAAKTGDVAGILQPSWRLTLEKEDNANTHTVNFELYQNNHALPVEKLSYLIDRTQISSWYTLTATFEPNGTSSGTASIYIDDQLVRSKQIDDFRLLDLETPITISSSGPQFEGMMDYIEIRGDAPTCYPTIIGPNVSIKNSEEFNLNGNSVFCENANEFAVGEPIVALANGDGFNSWHDLNENATTNRDRNGSFAIYHKNPATFVVQGDDYEVIIDAIYLDNPPQFSYFPVNGPMNVGVDSTLTTSNGLKCEESAVDVSNDVCHSGSVDIFAELGTPIVASQDGYITYECNFDTILEPDGETIYESIGGNVAWIEEPSHIGEDGNPHHWTHYYAHLDYVCAERENPCAAYDDYTMLSENAQSEDTILSSCNYRTFKDGDFITAGTVIGFVGHSGTAFDTAAHVHQSVYYGDYYEGNSTYPKPSYCDWHGAENVGPQISSNGNTQYSNIAPYQFLYPLEGNACHTINYTSPQKISSSSMIPSNETYVEGIVDFDWSGSSSLHVDKYVLELQYCSFDPEIEGACWTTIELRNENTHPLQEQGFSRTSHLNDVDLTAYSGHIMRWRVVAENKGAQSEPSAWAIFNYEIDDILIDEVTQVNSSDEPLTLQLGDLTFNILENEEAGWIIMDETADNPPHTNTEATFLANRWFIESTIPTGSFMTEITFPYSDIELSGYNIDESSLEVGFYDAEGQRWQTVEVIPS